MVAGGRWGKAAATQEDLPLVGDLNGAEFSLCRQYRYRLWRRWDNRPHLAVVMLNPSTATETKNDPTVARCEARARRTGYGGLEVANLFAFRSTSPAGLSTCADPVGQDNDKAILGACAGAGLVLLGWGAHGTLLGRDKAVLDLLTAAGHQPHHLGLTAGGQPRHPLYLGYDVKPRPWLRTGIEL